MSIGGGYMQSIRQIYKIGPGPSSSHTFGPMMAAKYMLEQYPQAMQFDVSLFGSLALTGKGHLTDKIIEKTFILFLVRFTLISKKKWIIPIP